MKNKATEEIVIKIFLFNMVSGSEKIVYDKCFTVFPCILFFPRGLIWLLKWKTEGRADSSVFLLIRLNGFQSPTLREFVGFRWRLSNRSLIFTGQMQGLSAAVGKNLLSQFVPPEEFSFCYLVCSIWANQNNYF